MPQLTAVELLRDLNQLDEHPRIEVKTGSGAGKSALQTVCAFANEPRLAGGYIVFGVMAVDDLFGRRYQPSARLIRRAEAAILDDLPKRFHLPPGDLQRSDVPRIPERVVREAVVNALMHRSYRTQAPTQIIRYSNRIEIRNPGHSLKAEDRLGEPGSETRNPPHRGGAS